MSLTQLEKICLLTFSLILLTNLAGSVPHSQMEASAGCTDALCMVRSPAEGNNTAHMERINIFSADGKDPRQPLDRGLEEALPFLPAGYAINNHEIVANLGGVKTITASNAFLVSPCYALADYHGVFGEKMSTDPEEDYSMTIWLGSGELKGGFRYALRMKPVRVSKETGHGRNGLILMQLERCAGSKMGWMNLDIPGAAALAGAQVGMVAYHQDRSKKTLWLQKNCTIHGYSEIFGLLKHDCASVPGSSGGIIFRIMNGVPTVVATNWGASSSKAGILKSYANEDSNLAVPLDMLKENPEMLKIIQDDITRFGGPNPALRKPAATDSVVDSHQSTS